MGSLLSSAHKDEPHPRQGWRFFSSNEDCAPALPLEADEALYDGVDDTTLEEYPAAADMSTRRLITPVTSARAPSANTGSVSTARYSTPRW